MKKLFLVPVLAIVLFLGCSKKDNIKPELPAPGSDIPGIEAIQVTNNIEINGNDNMKFDKDLFKVKASKEVTLTLKNIGKLPMNMMGHNVVVVKSNTDLEAFALEAMKEHDNDYIPQSAEMRKQIIAYTRLLGGGETDVIQFTPIEPAVYQFLCTFPGHYGTSHGKIVVVK